MDHLYQIVLDNEILMYYGVTVGNNIYIIHRWNSPLTTKTSNTSSLSILIIANR